MDEVKPQRVPRPRPKRTDEAAAVAQQPWPTPASGGAQAKQVPAPRKQTRPPPQAPKAAPVAVAPVAASGKEDRPKPLPQSVRPVTIAPRAVPQLAAAPASAPLRKEKPPREPRERAVGGREGAAVTATAVQPASVSLSRPAAAVHERVPLPRELHRERAEDVRRRAYEALPLASAVLADDALLVGAASRDVLEQAQLLIETLIAQQLQLQRRFALKDRLSEDVGRVQAEIDAGLRVEFRVEPPLLGMVIGAAGSNVRRVTEETGVDRVVVDREASVVRIVGHRAEDVARAREMLEICCVYIPVPEQKVGFIVGKEGRNINDIIAKAQLMVPGGMTMDRAKGSMRVLGTRAACEKARLLVEAQLSFLEQSDSEQLQVEEMKARLESMNTSWGEDSFLVMRGQGGHSAEQGTGYQGRGRGGYQGGYQGRGGRGGGEGRGGGYQGRGRGGGGGGLRVTVDADYVR